MTLTCRATIAESRLSRTGLFTWANLLESYCIGDRTKSSYGFDNWQGFTELSEQDANTSYGAGKTVVASMRRVFVPRFSTP